MLSDVVLTRECWVDKIMCGLIKCVSSQQLSVCPFSRGLKPFNPLMHVKITLSYPYALPPHSCPITCLLFAGESQQDCFKVRCLTFLSTSPCPSPVQLSCLVDAATIISVKNPTAGESFEGEFLKRVSACHVKYANNIVHMLTSCAGATRHRIAHEETTDQTAR